ncbi:hypothetical protein F4811DRAFT_573314 [Daldinia bambusicola]|nr:hypothetical protein F4811DRAFT_573314 [Daldinia bambusicola]
MASLLNMMLEGIRPSSSRREKQIKDTRCIILQLPTEMVVYISDFLNPSDLLLFSHTCRSIHTILGNKSSGVLGKSQARCTRRECIKYLSLLSKDLPDHWACEACTRLHVADEWDLPSRTINLTCPLGLSRWKERVYNGRTRIDCRFIALEHRHVQLTLKYLRTHDPKYRTYLRALLKPHYVSQFPPYMEVFWSMRNSRFSHSLKASYSARPKVALGLDGRPKFLLLSTWTYNYTDLAIAMSRKTLGDLAICPHIQFRSGESLYYARAIRPELEDALDIAIEAVQKRQHKSMQVCASCPQCPTDFAVKVMGRQVEIRAWQDMGTEGSPRDLSWRVHSMGFNFRENRACIDPSVPHPPGSVRDLFYKKQEPRLRQPRKWEDILDQMRRFWSGKLPGTVTDTPVEHSQNDIWEIMHLPNIKKLLAGLSGIGLN